MEKGERINLRGTEGQAPQTGEGAGATPKSPILKLDFHSAWKTNARTYWYVVTVSNELLSLEEAEENGILEVLWSNKVAGKTHWYKLIRILKPELVRLLMRERTGNRGNLSYIIYEPEQAIEELSARPEDMPAEIIKYAGVVED